MFIAEGEYKSQGPDTDYEYKLFVKGEKGNHDCFYAWTAHASIAEAGS